MPQPAIRTAAVADSGYKHLAALANQSKHYSIVFPALNEDLTGEREEQFMLEFPGFKSSRGSFPKVYVREFLPPVHEQLSRSVVQAGNALNEVLRSAPLGQETT